MSNDEIRARAEAHTSPWCKDTLFALLDKVERLETEVTYWSNTSKAQTVALERWQGLAEKAEAEVERLRGENDLLSKRSDAWRRIAENRSEKVERLSATVDAVVKVLDGVDALPSVYVHVVHTSRIRAVLDEHLGED